MELLLHGRYIIMIFSPLSSQFRINFCKNLQKMYCIDSVLYSKCLPCTKNAISRLTSGPQKSFTTLFSPDRHRKKAQYSFYHKNLEKGNKITNNEGYRFFGTPCTSLKLHHQNYFTRSTSLELHPLSFLNYYYMNDPTKQLQLNYFILIKFT